MPVSNDLRNDLNTDGVVGIGLANIATSNIDAAGDFDWLSVRLEAGQTYQIHMEPNQTMTIGGGAPASTLQPWARGIYSASGILLHANCSCQGATPENWAILSFTPQYSGNYFIEVSSRHNTSGSYLLYIPEPTEAINIPPATGSVEPAANVGSQARIALNSPVMNTIETAGDQDWFQVDLQAGEIYQINLDGVALSGARLSDPLIQGVYDQSGHYIMGSSNDDFNGLNSQVTFIAPANGSYFIAAAAYGNHTGDYRLNVTHTGSSSAPITVAAPLASDLPNNTTTGVELWVNQPFDSRIDRAGDGDWVRVQLEAGREYQINLDGISYGGPALLDPLLRGVYDQHGNYIAGTTNDDANGLNSQIRFTPQVSGSYFIAAEGYAGNMGHYVLQVTDSTRPMSADVSRLLGLESNALGRYIAPATLQAALEAAANNPSSSGNQTPNLPPEQVLQMAQIQLQTGMSQLQSLLQPLMMPNANDAVDSSALQTQLQATLQTIVTAARALGNAFDLNGLLANMRGSLEPVIMQQTMSGGGTVLRAIWTQIEAVLSSPNSGSTTDGSNGSTTSPSDQTHTGHSNSGGEAHELLVMQQFQSQLQSLLNGLANLPSGMVVDSNVIQQQLQSMFQPLLAAANAPGSAIDVPGLLANVRAMLLPIVMQQTMAGGGEAFRVVLNQLDAIAQTMGGQPANGGGPVVDASAIQNLLQQSMMNLHQVLQPLMGQQGSAADVDAIAAEVRSLVQGMITTTTQFGATAALGDVLSHLNQMLTPVIMQQTMSGNHSGLQAILQMVDAMLQPVIQNGGAGNSGSSNEGPVVQVPSPTEPANSGAAAQEMLVMQQFEVRLPELLRSFAYPASDATPDLNVMAQQLQALFQPVIVAASLPGSSIDLPAILSDLQSVLQPAIMQQSMSGGGETLRAVLSQIEAILLPVIQSHASPAVAVIETELAQQIGAVVTDGLMALQAESAQAMPLAPLNSADDGAASMPDFDDWQDGVAVFMNLALSAASMPEMAPAINLPTQAELLQDNALDHLLGDNTAAQMATSMVATMESEMAAIMARLTSLPTEANLAVI